ncbi:hypothetical protein ACFZ8E_07285 [Methylobacterium sp. HMF5984]|uniref:hypothetical protein n=1 Tax=Methylobacterium sp. HMF5984 TaxID=3367370 RepID=UPI00385197E1
MTSVNTLVRPGFGWGAFSTFTAGHLWMAALCGAIVMLVVVILKHLAARRDPAPDAVNSTPHLQKRI